MENSCHHALQAKYLEEKNTKSVVSTEEDVASYVNYAFSGLLTAAAENLFKILQCSYQLSESKYRLFR